MVITACTQKLGTRTPASSSGLFYQCVYTLASADIRDRKLTHRFKAYFGNQLELVDQVSISSPFRQGGLYEGNSVNGDVIFIRDDDGQLIVFTKLEGMGYKRHDLIKQPIGNNFSSQASQIATPAPDAPTSSFSISTQCTAFEHVPKAWGTWVAGQESEWLED